MSDSSAFSPRARAILTCSVLVLLLGMGTRATFGLFMQPMSLEHGWTRDIFSLAFAIQNIVWGISSPLFGMIADKYGSARAIVLGSVLYVIGLLGASLSHTPLALYGTLGVLVGLGQSGVTFAVVLGVVARNVSPAQRSTALGIASAGGSLGQFVMTPTGNWLIEQWQWQQAFWILAAFFVVLLPMAWVLRGKPAAPDQGETAQTLNQALQQALGHRSYHFLFWSFFVCGFHTGFITLHLPAYAKDQGLTLQHGAIAIALIGLFNVLGSYGCGWLGGRYSKKALLAYVYAGRSLFIALLLLFPLTPGLLYLFAAGMGLLWLGTVPLTNGLVGQIYGVRYASTLYGIIFFGHQIGSFIGIWLGGKIQVQTGSYDIVWWLGIGLALLAALICWPIDEKRIPSRLITNVDAVPEAK
ncbi:MFS transporter [Parvibium lacunae]|uniref:MFS transporter n=1 Tax=Parvibium lacunae TaxID=1888893 RepID=A0A368KYI3_9BURK|nr:MFS transporter [Parvibium lacunae]RCS56495.1 MFS transporter [Parvibium lacunae]